MRRAGAVRKPLRLPNFDYSLPGAYFVTITIQNRAHLLGSLNERAEVTLSAAGKMVEAWWTKLPEKFPRVTLDAYSTMPDHFHGDRFNRCDSRVRVRPCRFAVANYSMVQDDVDG